MIDFLNWKVKGEIKKKIIKIKSYRLVLRRGSKIGKVIKKKVKKVIEEFNNFYDDEFSDLENKFEKFDVEIPLKSALVEVYEKGQANKIEKLTERFEIRLTKLEKEILMELKNQGINISEELRKSILKLNKSFSKEKVEADFIKYEEEHLILIRELEKKIKEYKKIKTLRGKTEEEAQKLVNKRYLLKYEIINIVQRAKHLENYLNKYIFLFEKN